MKPGLAFALILFPGLISSAYAVHCWNAPEIMERVHRLEVAAQSFEQTLYDVRDYHFFHFQLPPTFMLGAGLFSEIAALP
jgi:hypothetical protein